MHSAIKPATAKQLRYLRSLAQKTGTTFSPPRSSHEASREINRMRQLAPRPIEPAERDGREGRYGTAPDDEPSETSDIKPSEDQAGDTNYVVRNGNGHRASRDVIATVVASHKENGARRQLITIPVGQHRLLIDRDLAGGSARLLARLTPEEPDGNARLIAQMYLADPTRARCRTLTRGDLQPTGKPERDQEPVAWDTPLIAGIASTFRIQPVEQPGLTTLRWAETDTSTGASETVALRHVVGRLEDYQPAVSITAAAIDTFNDDAAPSIVALRNELNRLKSSPIVLNRRLRELVQAAVSHEQATMSEIAMRCGHTRDGKHGTGCGETSWLARRIGALPEAGYARPTPWVHTDVLAQITRDGLNINPCEAELG
jgi:hypothetical protein